MRYAQRFLGTPVPPSVTQALRFAAPPWPALALMGRLVAWIVRAESSRHLGPATARHLLYLRSHWLRMPPLLLARHLATKAAMRLRDRSPSNQARR